MNNTNRCSRKAEGKFTVPVAFKFVGTVEIEASTNEEAAAIAESSFGLTLGGGLHANDARISDWSYDMHPEKEIANAVEKTV